MRSATLVSTIKLFYTTTILKTTLLISERSSPSSPDIQLAKFLFTVISNAIYK